MVIRIASRKSDLARIQAYTVGDRLQAAHPNVEIQYHFRESLGDQNLNDPLWKMPEKGVFTEDFVEDLKTGRQDIVVHSWKDLPTEERPGLEIAATFKREDLRDLLFFKKSSVEKLRDDLSRGSVARNALNGPMKILTSSPRRIYNLGRFLPQAMPRGLDSESASESASERLELSFESVRGNVQTRLRKLLEGDADGLVLAKAGLDRFFSMERDEFDGVKAELRDYLDKLNWMVLPLSENPTAPAQGALAIEIRSDREDLKKLLQPLHDQLTFDQVQAERREFSAYGGGCHQKIGLNIFALGDHTLRSLQGVTESGESLQGWNFVEDRGRVLEFSREEIFSSILEDVDFFDREHLDVDHELLSQRDLYVSKSIALPESLNTQGLVWAAGVKTWLQLASRGVWVNGCSDSLGEGNSLGSLDLLHGRPVHWLKIGHEGGVGEKLFATYRLKDKELDSSIFLGKKCFFWSSGSQFLRAFELSPEIVQGLHCCGPGHTKDIIASKAPIERIEVFLNHQHWLDSFKYKID